MEGVDFYNQQKATAAQVSRQPNLALVAVSFAQPWVEVESSNKLLNFTKNLILLKLNFADNDRGRGFWKFNQSLLEDENFISETRQFISDFFVFNNGSANLHIVWDAFKCAFRGHAIKYSAWKYKQKCNRQRILLDDVQMIKNRQDANKSNCIDQDIQLSDEKEKELERFYQNKIKGIIY